MSLIERLREKSDTYKRNFSIATSFVITLAIFTVWATMFFPGTASQRAVIAESVKKEATPMKNFGSNMAQSFYAMKDRLGVLNQYFKSETTYQAQNQIQVVDKDQKTTQTNNLKANNPATNKGNSVIY